MNKHDESAEENFDFDKRVGQNLARFRMKMPQQELADEMRRRGFKWSQATVWSTEKGERPVRLSEVVALSEILDRPYDSFFVEERKIDFVEKVMVQKDLLALRREALKQQIKTWIVQRQTGALLTLITKGRDYAGLPARTQTELSADLELLEFYATRDSITDIHKEAEAEVSAEDTSRYTPPKYLEWRDEDGADSEES